jgi:L-2,4-diaminobutyrate transaminase
MPHGEILGFAPPLIATPSDVDEIVQITREAVDAVADALVRDSLWRAA